MVEETIKTGIKLNKSSRKLVLERHFGKSNETCRVVCIIEEDFLEVKTAWKRQGR